MALAKHTRTWIIACLCPLAWLLGTWLSGRGVWLLPRVQTQLEETQRLIEDFAEVYQRLPLHTMEIRLHARSQGQKWAPYDAYGQGLSYLALGDQAFLLKSFGSDAQENGLDTPIDPTILRGVGALDQGITASFSNLSQPRLYQAAFLDGLLSPQQSLLARLFIHPALGSRRMIVIDPRKEDRVLVAFHDAVEEFLWLPSGHELIFTAQGSQRYEDGVYYWNLKTGRTHNLLPSIQEKLWPDNPREDTVYTSLSHVSIDPPLVYLYAARAQGSSLDPSQFYRLQNFIALTIIDSQQEPVLVQRVPHVPDYSTFDYPVLHTDLIDPVINPGPMQELWLKLSLVGHPEELIDQWQNFCSRAAGHPLLPYGLWWLASLYNDSFRHMSSEAPDQAQVLRNFGIEIAEALSSLSSAPAYLRAMGEQLKKSLLLSQVTDYNVSSFQQETAPVQPAGPGRPGGSPAGAPQR